MKRIENDCVDCGRPCLGNACRYRNVPHYYCDKCGDEATLYEYDGRELCEHCIISSLKKVGED